MARKKKRVEATPESTYVPPPPLTPLRPADVAAVGLRHAIPLVAVLFFGGSLLQFLLLSLFDVAVGVASIVVVGVAVSTRNEVGDRGTVDALASLLMLALVGLAVSLGITAMFGWSLMVVASDTPDEVYNAMLGWSVFGIVLGTIPALMKRYRDDRREGLSEAQRQARDRPQVLVHVFCAGVLFFMWGLFGQFGYGGLVVLALLVTAVFTYRDLRPEHLPRVLFPNLPAPKP